MDELHNAILTVYSGGAMINPGIATKVVKLFSQMAKSNYSIKINQDHLDDISKTEWRVIQQVASGLSNKEIASQLYLSEGTVRNYLSNISFK